MNLWQRGKDQYKGLEMHCAPGTHEAALALAQRHNAPRLSVLDVGSGTGAFLARLQDSGFVDLHAVELDVGNFNVNGICAMPIDLNTDFASRFARRFHMITAIEIIEHLEAPRHFLRQIYQLLEGDGLLLISTPNVANWLGRMTFLVKGELLFFDEYHYHYMRHIAPLTDVQMQLMFKEIGFTTIDSITAGDFAGPLSRLATAPIRLVFRWLYGRKTLHDVIVYLVRKTMPDYRSPGTSSHYSAKRPKKCHGTPGGETDAKENAQSMWECSPPWRN